MITAGGTGKETREKETQMEGLRYKTRLNEEHWESAEGRGENTGLRWYCGGFCWPEVFEFKLEVHCFSQYVMISSGIH